MNIQKDIYFRIIFFLFQFIIYLILITIKVLTPGFDTLFSDYLIIKYFINISILLYALLQLAVCSIYKIEKYNSIYVLNILTYISLFISVLPLGFFMCSLIYVNKKFLVVYFLILFFFLMLTLVKSKKVNTLIYTLFFVPSIILIILSSQINYEAGTEKGSISPYVNIHELDLDITNIQERKEAESTGTFGSLLKLSVDFNAHNNYYFYNYSQYSSLKNSYIRNKIKDEYFPVGATKTSLDNVDLYIKEDRYFLESDDAIIIIDTNAKLNPDLLLTQSIKSDSN